MHFNPDHPENHNTIIPNKKETLAKVYDDGTKRGIFRDKKKTIRQITDKACGFILAGDGSVNSACTDKFINDVYSDDPVVIKKLAKETEMTILNNQHIVTNPALQ